jgi:hypothetical protein
MYQYFFSKIGKKEDDNMPREYENNIITRPNDLRLLVRLGACSVLARIQSFERQDGNIRFLFGISSSWYPKM